MSNYIYATVIVLVILLIYIISRAVEIDNLLKGYWSVDKEFAEDSNVKILSLMIGKKESTFPVNRPCYLLIDDICNQKIELNYNLSLFFSSIYVINAEITYTDDNKCWGNKVIIRLHPKKLYLTVSKINKKGAEDLMAFLWKDNEITAETDILEDKNIAEHI